MPSVLRVVVDANVWVSALLNPDGRPGRLLEAARRNAFELVASWALADELADLLSRPSTKRCALVDRQIQDILVLLAPYLPEVDVAIEPRDPDDAPVVASAHAGNADMIVTGDRGQLDDDLRAWLAERRIELLTPAELLERMTA